MKVELIDAALNVPPAFDDITRERRYWGAWHWLWSWVFGRRVPTSGRRAHIGKLVLQYRQGTQQSDIDGFDTKWLTDARRIYVIGDLWVFDYGDTPCITLTPEWDIASALHKNYKADHSALLRENIEDYRDEPMPEARG